MSLTNKTRPIRAQLSEPPLRFSNKSVTLQASSIRAWLLQAAILCVNFYPLLSTWLSFRTHNSPLDRQRPSLEQIVRLFNLTSPVDMYATSKVRAPDSVGGSSLPELRAIYCYQPAHVLFSYSLSLRTSLHHLETRDPHFSFFP